MIRQLKSSLIAIGVEPKYRFVARPRFERGPKGEPDALIIAQSEIVDLLRLKLIR
jgi:hypothetical protein